MHRYLLAVLFGVLVYLQPARSQGSTVERIILVSDLKADLDQLRHQLTKRHPSLYRYTPEASLLALFDSLSQSLDRPITAMEFYSRITALCSNIRDGHTVVLPPKSIINDRNAHRPFLPYQLVVVDGRLFVSMVCTSHPAIHDGDEIEEINGVPAKDIIQALTSRLMADGDNTTYPQWIINSFFRQYYSFVFGNPDSFHLVYRSGGQQQSATVGALSLDAIQRYRADHYASRYHPPRPGDGLTLSVANDSGYAVLTIRDFHKHALRKTYQQPFEKTIAGYFDRIRAAHVQHLILDLRNNQGGDLSNAVCLLAHLTTGPFQVVQRYNRLKNQRLAPCGGPATGMHHPRPNAFAGDLIVLANGGSFSATGMVLACLRAYRPAVFIGEESGGNPAVINGFVREVKLSHTGIQVQIPTKQFVITSSTGAARHGSLPDHAVTPSIQDLIAGKDAEMSFAISLVSQKTP